MTGTVVQALVKAGEVVEKGQVLMVVEAMKMEHSIKAPTDGIIKEVLFAASDQVSDGAQLVTFEAAEDK
ncbi:MAG: biotin/lipoyl-containing protein, partial [Rhodospirillales bacterium]|jgi:3-methylcrotonyl-CoA carboxylase alpha subunit